MTQRHRDQPEPSAADSNARDAEPRSRAKVDAEPRAERTATDAAKARAGRRWIAGVVALLVVHVGVMIVLVTSSRGDPSHQVIPDYYRKALAWDSHMAQQRRNAELGWKLSLDIAKAVADGAGLLRRRVTVTLRDRAGKAIEGATVRVRAFHKARAARVRSATLMRVTTPGRYAATMRIVRAGLWEVHVVVERGKQRFTKKLEPEVP